MSLYPLALNLTQARSNVQVQGKVAWLSAWTVGATVTPTLLLQDPSGTTRQLAVTLPVTVQTPLIVVSVNNAQGTGTLYLLMSDDPCDSIAVGSSGGDGSGRSWSVDRVWPQANAKTLGSAYSQDGETFAGANYSPMMNLAGLAGLVSFQLHPASQFLVLQAVQRNAGMVMGAIFPYLSGALPPTWTMPESHRVHWWQWTMSVTGGIPTEQTGVEIMLNLGVMGWIHSGNNGCAVGIVGDGAGAWLFFARRGFAARTVRTFTNPTPLAQLMTFDILMYPAGGANNARLKAYCNGTLIVDEFWSAGGILPFPSDFAPNAASWQWGFQANNGAGLALWLGPVRYRRGGYDITGAQL